MCKLVGTVTLFTQHCTGTLQAFSYFLTSQVRAVTFSFIHNNAWANYGVVLSSALGSTAA